jgi:hypothetical protein
LGSNTWRIPPDGALYCGADGPRPCCRSGSPLPAGQTVRSCAEGRRTIELALGRDLVKEESSRGCLEIDRPPETSLDDIESKRDEDLRLKKSYARSELR